MIDLFGKPKKKNDGGDSKIKELPDIREVGDGCTPWTDSLTSLTHCVVII